MTHPSGDSFPRQNARTQRFSLGRPRSFTVSDDGATVLFVRSASGTDRSGRLWRWTATDGEVELVDPGTLLAGDEELSAQERARRERSREAAGGIVGYSVDRAFRQATFTLSGRLFVTDVAAGTTRELSAASPVIDPRIDPTGRRVAYVTDGRLHVLELDDGSDRVVTPTEPSEAVSWGLADFIAAEELERSRGFWWSPDGSRLLVQRTDESAVTTWYVSNPADPSVPSVSQRYPEAGSTNAEVSLWLVPLDGTAPIAVDLPADAEYVTTVHWGEHGLPVVAVLDRRQQRMTWLAIFPDDGSTRAVRAVTDDAWVDVIPGSGCWDADGRLVTVEVRDGDYALCTDGERISPVGLQVRAVVDADRDVLVHASQDAADQQVWRISRTSAENVTPAPGWHLAARGGETIVTVAATLETRRPVTTITDGDLVHEVRSFAEVPVLEPRVTILPSRPDQPRVALILPTGWHQGGEPLPVLMDPYGGPHFASVLNHQGAFLECQWFADQGFAVVVVDGRGTPGVPAWERGVRYDVSSVVLDDQVTGLHAAAHAFPDLDLGRVAIRGWSFGGYLAAMAVIDRPDVFHAAISGAPVTDWRLYDTGYTERYLGLPDEQPDAYARTGLLDRAPGLTRPLQLIHGFADDNVFIANTLRLSQVLTEQGRPHEVLPLTGITHMATQEQVAENTMLLQVDFLRRALNLKA